MALDCDCTQGDVGGEAAGSLGARLCLRRGLSTAHADRMSAPALRSHADVMLIHSPRQLVAVLPHVLQFHPHDSIVCVGLDGAQIACVARFDIDDSATCDLEPVLTALRQCEQPAYVVVVYSDGPVALCDVDHIVAQCGGVAQLDVLAVGAARWRSLLCEDQSCCPPDGHPMDESVDVLAVDLVAMGSAPFASRDDVVSSLETRSLSVRELADRDAAFSEDSRPWDCTRQGLDDLLALLTQEIPMPWPQAAMCCQLLDDFRWRDAVLRHIHDNVALRLPVRASVTDLVTRCPERYVAPLATTLAGVVWLDGNSALARIAVDRALEADASYTLARLLDRALRSGVPPRVWVDSLRALTVEDCLAA